MYLLTQTPIPLTDITMTSLPLAHFFSQLHLPPNITVAADNAQSPSCTRTTVSNNHDISSIPTRKGSYCRWSSQYSKIPSIPTRNHDNRWDSSPTKDTAPMKLKRSSDPSRPIDILSKTSVCALPHQINTIATLRSSVRKKPGFSDLSLRSLCSLTTTLWSSSSRLFWLTTRHSSS
jgi:hypothetical protein